MNHKKHFIFHCLFFGRYFRNSFLDYLLDSLIQAGLIEFSSRFRVIFIISTDPADRIVIENHPNFTLLEKYLTFEFHEVSYQVLHSMNRYKNVSLMKEAHKYAACYAEKLDSFLGILVPDMVVNNEYFKSMDEAIESEINVLLTPALRMTYLDQFLSSKHDEKKDPYKSSNLVMSSVRNLHSETKSFVFSTSEFLEYQGYVTPTAALFQHKQIPNCFVGFGMSWFIVYIDFSKLTGKTKSLIQKSLSQHTLDAYVIDSISQQKNTSIDFIRDSNRMFVLSWDKSEGIKRDRVEVIHSEMNSRQKCDLIELGLLSGLYDNFKIKNYSNPFFWNGSDSVTDKNLSNYNIDSLFKSRFLSGNMINFKPGFLIYFVKFIRFSVSATFTSMNSLDANFDFEKPRSRKVSRKVSGKALQLIKVLGHIATYKLTVRNPLNQPLGNRFLAVLRLITPRYFSWKIRKSKVAEKN
jgi:hypothetical protein